MGRLIFTLSLKHTIRWKHLRRQGTAQVSASLSDRAVGTDLLSPGVWFLHVMVALFLLTWPQFLVCFNCPDLAFLLLQDVSISSPVPTKMEKATKDQSPQVMCSGAEAPSLLATSFWLAERGYAIISTGCTFLVTEYKHSHKVLFNKKKKKLVSCFLCYSCENTLLFKWGFSSPLLLLCIKIYINTHLLQDRRRTIFFPASALLKYWQGGTE